MVKAIKKCQEAVFKDEFYQLTDNQDDYYAMHTTEKGEVNFVVCTHRKQKGLKMAISFLT